MSRIRVIYNTDGSVKAEFRDGELVGGVDNDPAPASYYVMPDLSPYRSMQTGEMIGGRRQHREHLKEHRLIELGNEKIQPWKPPAPPPGLRDEVARQYFARK